MKQNTSRRVLRKIQIHGSQWIVSIEEMIEQIMRDTYIVKRCNLNGGKMMQHVFTISAQGYVGE